MLCPSQLGIPATVIPRQPTKLCGCPQDWAVSTFKNESNHQRTEYPYYSTLFKFYLEAKKSKAKSSSLLSRTPQLNRTPPNVLNTASGVGNWPEDEETSRAVCFGGINRALMQTNRQYIYQELMNRSLNGKEDFAKVFRKQSGAVPEGAQTERPDPYGSRRFSERVGSFSFLPQLQNAPPQNHRNPLGMSRLELEKLASNESTRLDAMLTDRNITSRVEKDDDIISQSDVLKQSYLTFINGSTSNQTTASQIESLPCKAPLSSLKEEAYKRENMRLRAENLELKAEIFSLKASLTLYNQQKYEQLESAFKELERNNSSLERQLRDSFKKNDLFEQENSLYKEIIDKLQKRIDVLLTENGQLDCALQTSISKIKELEIVEDRVEKLKGAYSLLELQVAEDDREWDIHKDLWINEREYYKEIIRKLEFQLEHQRR